MIELLNIDCMEYMKTMPDKYFDLAIVDPPYGIKRDEGFEGFGGFGGFGKPIARKKYKSWGDEETPKSEYFTELFRVSENAMIFGGNFFTDKIPVGKHWIFWDKRNTMPTFGDGELIYTNYDRNSVKEVVCEWNGLIGKEKDPRIHATQKPVALYKWLLKNYAKPEMKILDTHGGSFSSAIACYDFGTVEYVGCELDKDYYDAAVKRFNYHKSQVNMFERTTGDAG